MLMHSLWLCDQAQYVWKSDPSFVSLYQRQYRSFLDLISKVLDRFSTYRIALFSTIAWVLWQRRNQIRERQHSWNLSELGSRAKELIGEYFSANSQPSHHAPRLAKVHWCPSPEQHYKGNFDAAFFYASGCAGIGMVFRDHTGQAIAALSQKIPLVQTVELVEALAARTAVGFALELSLFSVELEGDLCKGDFGFECFEEL